jgi:hypothetical protein
MLTALLFDVRREGLPDRQSIPREATAVSS